jgi:DNA polymerase-3 subunit gamma/tau
MEVLGSTMVEMRHAPDSRLLLEVAVVQLAAPSFDDSTENLLARISQLEEAVKQLKEQGVAAALPPAPLNPATGRAKIGGRAAAGAAVAPSAASNPTHATSPGTSANGEVPTADSAAPKDPTAPTSAPAEVTKDVDEARDDSGAVEAPVAAATSGDPAQMWPQVTDAMKGLPKAIFKPAIVESFDGKKLTIKLPANTPVKRAQDQSVAVVDAVKKVCGVTCTVVFTQADPTSGIERPSAPVEEKKPKTIDKIVEDDPYAEVDMKETTAVNDAIDPVLAALQDSFPDGVVIDDTSAQ